MVSVKSELTKVYTCISTEFSNLSVHELASFMEKNGLLSIFPETYKLAELILTIPSTIASVERSFSALKRIHTFLRNLRTKNEKKDFLQKLPPRVDSAETGEERSSISAGVRASHVRCTQAHAHTKRVPREKCHKYLINGLADCVEIWYVDRHLAGALFACVMGGPLVHRRTRRLTGLYACI